MNHVKRSDILAERLANGGWLLSVTTNSRRIRGRYFEHTLREAKARFLADVKAGAI